MNQESCQFVSRTIRQLFRKIEEQGLRYAVLRNYEHLPEIRHQDGSGKLTDLDLALDGADLEAWRNIAAAVASDEGWDTLIECRHWRSAVPEQQIEVFRFFRTSPPACLQVDIFHSYLLWGLPLSSESDMLQDAERDENNLFLHIDRRKENAYRLLQLYSLLDEPNQHDKVARYNCRLADFWRRERKAFAAYLRPLFSRHAEYALDALALNNLEDFRIQMRRAKLFFFAKRFFSTPVTTTQYFATRFSDHLRRWIFDQCGFVLNVYAPGMLQHRTREALQKLEANGFVDEWAELDLAARRPSWAHRKIMEQSGLVIRWTDRDAAALDATQFETSEEIFLALADLLLERHAPLFERVPDQIHSIPQEVLS